MSETIYVVAGEASGDNHGAELLSALRALLPEAQFAGRGGSKMRGVAGSNIVDWTADAAVVGLWEVVKKYGYFREQFRRTVDEIRRINPRAVVLVDYPGFNLRLARALRRENPQRKIVYYISPQVWAWNRGRIRAMANDIDLMLCIFPFETGLYNASGLRTTFVGHPLVNANTTTTAREANLVGIFPGSRDREVRKIFPIMRNVAEIMTREDPELRFRVAAATPALADLIRADLEGDTAFEIHVDGARELMQSASAAMVASGTATLEAAVARLPFVLVYRVSWLTYFAARLVVKVDYLGMPNVLAGREIVPEFIQHEARPAAIASAVRRLLTNDSARREQLAAFDEVAAKLGSGDAAHNAARHIAEELERA